MKKTYVKIIIQEIKHSIGRFTAIFGIVALSVGFLSGLLATTPNMKATADEFFDQNNLYDIFIKGTKGLTEKDIRAVKEIGGIDDIMPAYVTDALLETSNNGVLTARIYGLPFFNGNDVNKLRLISGRMPENKYEAVVEKSFGHITEINIGEKLRISETNKDYEEIDDTYAVNEYEVVGIVSNSSYFSVEVERTGIGNGRIGAIVYVDESCYSLDVYTDFYITLMSGSSMTAFTGEYEDYVDDKVEILESVGEKQSSFRDLEIKEEAYEKLNDAKTEYEEAKAEAEVELADAAKEIEDGRLELLDAWKDIKEGKLELADAKVTLEEELQDAEKEIKEGYEELADAKIELDDGEKEYVEGLIELADGKKEYEDGLQEFIDAEEELKDAQKEFDEGEQEFLDGVKKYEDGRSELRAGARELAAAKEQLIKAEAEYEAGAAELNMRKAQFEVLSGQIIAQIATRSAITSTEELMLAIEEEVTTPGAIYGTVTGILNYMSAQGYPVPDSAGAMLENYKELKAGEESLEEARTQIAYGWIQYEQGSAKLSSGKRKLNKAKDEIDKGREELEENRVKLQDAWKELEEGRIELEDAKKEIEDGEKELRDGRIELDDGWQEYYDGLEEIKDAGITLQEEIKKANKEIEDGEIELSDGIIEYQDGLLEFEDGEREYLEAKADAEKELNDAAIKISDAEKEIEDLEIPKWYVLDRNSNVSYLSFALNVEKVADVAAVFPIFFFLIAALVTLTTMTRMVEEERTQIGTLKALGYKKITIISKYIIYCGLASTLGSIAGTFLGFRLLPNVIWNAYRSMYALPDLTNHLLLKYALPITLISILSTVIVTLYVSLQTLKEKPSTLMLPRAPKAGKRIFLERVGFIWKRMKFTHKSTARNIFRYKRHFYMTVTGIAGCTALMVTGFGLLDSISAIANTQFEDIFKYDLTIQLEDKEKDDVLNNFLLEHEIYAEAMSDTVYIDNKGEELNATAIIPKNNEKLNEVISLNDRTTGNSIHFGESSVIMTEKLAENLGLKAGDKFMVKNEDDVEAEFVLTDITENYVGIYLYINKSDYQNAFNEEIEYNTIMVDSNIEEGKPMDKTIEELLKGEIMSAEPLSQLKKSFDSLLTNINFIVTVLVFSSAALAFIVLYNLTNININERRKELSALKVLGYHREEIAAYVFRETVILSLLGTIAGLFLGKLLHTFVIISVEAPNLMLGRDISISSYAMAAILTFVFSLIVNLFLTRKLNKIEMVESMKAIE